jgi:hypothetical protein
MTPERDQLLRTDERRTWRVTAGVAGSVRRRGGRPHLVAKTSAPVNGLTYAPGGMGVLVAPL